MVATARIAVVIAADHCIAFVKWNLCAHYLIRCSSSLYATRVCKTPEASRSVRPFLQHSLMCPTHTHTRTDHATSRHR